MAGRENNRSRRVPATPTSGNSVNEVAAASLTPEAQAKAAREKLFKAMSILETCKYACASLYEVDDLEYMVPALEAAHDFVGAAASQLEEIARDVERKHAEAII